MSAWLGQTGAGAQRRRDLLRSSGSQLVSGLGLKTQLLRMWLLRAVPGQKTWALDKPAKALDGHARGADSCGGGGVCQALCYSDYKEPPGLVLLATAVGRQWVRLVASLCGLAVGFPGASVGRQAAVWLLSLTSRALTEIVLSAPCGHAQQLPQGWPGVTWGVSWWPFLPFNDSSALEDCLPAATA